MQFYEFGDALRPLGEKAPEKWENVLAILEPEEVDEVALPAALTPQHLRQAYGGSGPAHGAAPYTGSGQSEAAPPDWW